MLTFSLKENLLAISLQYYIRISLRPKTNTNKLLLDLSCSYSTTLCFQGGTARDRHSNRDNTEKHMNMSLKIQPVRIFQRTYEKCKKFSICIMSSLQQCNYSNVLTKTSQ